MAEHRRQRLGLWLGIGVLFLANIYPTPATAQIQLPDSGSGWHLYDLIGQTAVQDGRIFTELAAGDKNHTCAVTADGGVKCWGDNQDGKLGDGTTLQRMQPVDVSGFGSGVRTVTSGGDHTCALTVSGGVKCWGRNQDGQLGDSTTTTRLTPVDVHGLGSGVIAISAGENHTCALTSLSGVKCWGKNTLGQLGDGTTTTRLTPVDVIGLSIGVGSISTGGDHTCALTSRGGVKCWGGNVYGQLGDGTNKQRITPVDVSNLTTAMIAISVGGDHTCALTSTGGVLCWGYNWYGQLGDGTINRHPTPVAVSGLTQDVSAISAGERHTCALSSDGGVKCWGYNRDGRLGDGTTSQRSIPISVVHLDSGVIAISAGGNHSCVITSRGAVKCWGLNLSGQLGDGTTDPHLTPTDLIELTSSKNAISAGWNHTCALTPRGGVVCWGRNGMGQLGDGSVIDRVVPTAVIGLDSGVSGIFAGGNHTCALTVLGGVKCWGSNRMGQLGDGTLEQRHAPVYVSGMMSGMRAIASGGDHTCALTVNGGVKCWGRNLDGQLGDSTTQNRLTPVDVVGLSSGVTAISAGGNHTCALTNRGVIKCWGRNGMGQLGDTTTTSRFTPVDAAGLTSGFGAVAAGGDHTCALTTRGEVKCWGGNWQGQLGDGTLIQHPKPALVKGLDSEISTITAGYTHTCTLSTSGKLMCWGDNWFGQLGDGTTIVRLNPVAVAGLESKVILITSGYSHTCAMTSDRKIKCWGDNWYGQLGDGTRVQHAAPVDTTLPGSE